MEEKLPIKVTSSTLEGRKGNGYPLIDTRLHRLHCLFDVYQIFAVGEILKKAYRSMERINVRRIPFKY